VPEVTGLENMWHFCIAALFNGVTYCPPDTRSKAEMKVSRKEMKVDKMAELRKWRHHMNVS
jgi:hypothetical protein